MQRTSEGIQLLNRSEYLLEDMRWSRVEVMIEAGLRSKPTDCQRSPLLLSKFMRSSISYNVDTTYKYATTASITVIYFFIPKQDIIIEHELLWIRHSQRIIELQLRVDFFIAYSDCGHLGGINHPNTKFQRKSLSHFRDSLNIYPPDI